MAARPPGKMTSLAYELLQSPQIVRPRKAAAQRRAAIASGGRRCGFPHRNRRDQLLGRPEHYATANAVMDSHIATGSANRPIVEVVEGRLALQPKVNTVANKQRSAETAARRQGLGYRPRRLPDKAFGHSSCQQRSRATFPARNLQDNPNDRFCRCRSSNDPGCARVAPCLIAALRVLFSRPCCVGHLLPASAVTGQALVAAKGF